MENSKPSSKKVGTKHKLKKMPTFVFIDQQDNQFDIWIISLEQTSGISSGEFIRKLKPFLDDSKMDILVL